MPTAWAVFEGVGNFASRKPAFQLA